MRRIPQITFLSFTFFMLLTACNPAATATPIPAIPLDTADSSTLSQVQASAVVVPAQEARLSYVISGLVENVAVAEGDQVQLGQVLAMLDTSGLEYNLIAAEAALTQAEIDAQLQRQRRRKFNFDTFNFEYVSPPGEKIVIADAKVEQLRSALEVVKASIAQGTLTAPFDGTVVEVYVSPGEYVQPAQVVIVMVATEDLQIETTDLSELNITTVEIGQPATVYVQALDEEFRGVVTTISPKHDTIGGDVVYPVIIQLDVKPAELLWGMSAEVEIDVE